MNTAQLCLHTGETDRVTRDTLQALPLPQPLSRRHRPVAHIALVEAIQAGSGSERRSPPALTGTWSTSGAWWTRSLP